MDDVARLWSYLPGGYLFTILIETPILLVGLSAAHPVRRRLLAGVWLTAVTYPIVVLVLPVLFGVTRDNTHYTAYVIVAEIFAPAAECSLFSLAFHGAGVTGMQRLRDWAAIVAANLASFGIGWWLQ